jgi:hypothetical protein
MKVYLADTIISKERGAIQMKIPKYIKSVAKISKFHV